MGLIERRARAGCILLSVLLLVLLINPLSIGYVRAGILLLTTLLWLAISCLTWRRRILRWLPLATALVVLGALLLPGRDHNPLALRGSYVRSLKFYKGALYCWGGENRVGIDCSGLVRRGLFVANLKQGLRTLNPSLFRQAARLWWQDASARELHNGYRGRARHIMDADSINELDHELLSPGDFAITRGGLHALVYLGDHVWIEADPGEMRVICVTVPVVGNSWFQVPVHIMRWRQLEGNVAVP